MNKPGETPSVLARGNPCVLFRTLVLVIPILAVSCSYDPMTPKAPTWDVDLTVPITDRKLTLGEMIERDTSLIHVGAGNQLVFSRSVAAPPAYIGDQLSFTPSYGTALLHLGPFNVTVDPVSMCMNVPGLPPGATTPIPATSFSLSDVPNVMPGESAIRCASGTIGMTVRNNLPVQIIGTSPARLVDALGTVQAFFDFTGISIPPGRSQTVYDTLAGRMLGNGAGISGLGFQTPGSSVPVKIPADSMIVTTVFVSGIRVSEAQMSGLPAQRLTDNDKATMEIEDSTIVQEVVARSGRIAIDFRNKINLGVVLKFRLSELWHPVEGRMVQFEDSVSLSASGEASCELNLAGYRIASPSGGLVTSLELVSSIIIPNDINTPVGLHDTDKVEVSMKTLSPIVIDTAAAVLKPTWVDMNTVVGLNLRQFTEKFRWQLLIPSASLVLKTEFPVGCPADLYLTLRARKNAAGEFAALQVPATQRRLSGGQGAIVFDESEVGAFLSQLSGGLPDSIWITGKVLVNPSDAYDPTSAGIRTFGSNCSLGGTVNLTIPLKVGFGGSMYCDTIEVANGAQHHASGEIEGVNMGKVMMELDNALPMQVGVKLKLLDFLKQPMLTIPQSGMPVQITSASVDGQGNVMLPAHSKVVLELNHAEAQMISPADYVEYTFDLSTSLGSPAVYFKTSDYIHVRSWSEISYRVDR